MSCPSAHQQRLTPAVRPRAAAQEVDRQQHYYLAVPRSLPTYVIVSFNHLTKSFK